MKEFDIEKLVSEMDFESNQLQKVNQHIMLTNHEIEVLKKYQIPYSHCMSLKEIIYEIEEILSEEELDDLEGISESISERDYYQNTNK